MKILVFVWCFGAPVQGWGVAEASFLRESLIEVGRFADCQTVKPYLFFFSKKAQTSTILSATLYTGQWCLHPVHRVSKLSTHHCGLGDSV